MASFLCKHSICSLKQIVLHFVHVHSALDGLSQGARLLRDLTQMDPLIQGRQPVAPDLHAVVSLLSCTSLSLPICNYASAVWGTYILVLMHTKFITLFSPLR